MSEFVEIEALASVAANVVTIDDPREGYRERRFLFSIDVTGLDKDAARKKCQRSGDVLARWLGHKRIMIMEERNGVPDARVFVLQDSES